jgi:hypothetical protein
MLFIFVQTYIILRIQLSKGTCMISRTAIIGGSYERINPYSNV